MDALENNKIDFVVIEKFNSEMLKAAAMLHIKHLSYRSFITMLGNKFMLELYRDILSDNLGFFVFALHEKRFAVSFLDAQTASNFLVLLKEDCLNILL